MKPKLAKLLTVGSCLVCTVVTGAQSTQRSELPARVPARNTCTLLADYGPVWLWVFEETETNGDRGWMLYVGKLARGEKKVITSGIDRVRYFFRTGKNDEMHGDVGAWCYKGNTNRVPGRPRRCSRGWRAPRQPERELEDESVAEVSCFDSVCAGLVSLF